MRWVFGTLKEEKARLDASRAKEDEQDAQFENIMTANGQKTTAALQFNQTVIQNNSIQTNTALQAVTR